MNKTPEQQLLLRARGGDATAFSELFFEYSKCVYNYLLRCGLSVSESEDLTQDVFLAVYQHFDTFDIQRPFKPWLFTIVSRRVGGFLRKQRVQLCGNYSSEVIADGPVAETRETLRFVLDEVRKLPPLQRQAVLLVCAENLSQEDAAQAMEVPVSTFKTLLRRGRLKLARAMHLRQERISKEVNRA